MAYPRATTFSDSSPLVSVHAGGAGYWSFPTNTQGHTCALFESGKGRCWGDNSLNELGGAVPRSWGTSAGDMSTLPYLSFPLAGATTTLTAIFTGACAYQVTCGLFTNGRTICWGKAGPYLGQGTSDPAMRPVSQLSFISFADNTLPIVTMGLGQEQACAVWSNGRARCWGGSTGGKLGLAPGVGTSNACPWGPNLGCAASDMSSLAYIEFQDPTERVLSMTAGRGCTCALFEKGLRCFGPCQEAGPPRQGSSMTTLGYLAFKTTHVPTQVTYGVDHCICARFSNGGVRCWNDEGQWGFSGMDNERKFYYSDLPSLDFISFATTHPAVAVAAGDAFACALFEGLGTRCWGRNDEGQLGQPTPRDRLGNRPGDMASLQPILTAKQLVPSKPAETAAPTPASSNATDAGTVVFVTINMNSATVSWPTVLVSLCLFAVILAAALAVRFRGMFQFSPFASPIRAQRLGTYGPASNEEEAPVRAEEL
jgi:hypothetical protein